MRILNGLTSLSIRISQFYGRRYGVRPALSHAGEESGVVLLALHEVVHVELAEADVVGVILEAGEEVKVVLLAGVLLSGGLLHLLRRGLLSILNGGALNLLLLSGGTTMGRAGAHDRANGVVSDGGTGSHGHTSGEGATETHAAATGGLSRGWRVMVVHGGLRSGGSGSAGLLTGTAKPSASAGASA